MKRTESCFERALQMLSSSGAGGLVAVRKRLLSSRLQVAQGWPKGGTGDLHRRPKGGPKVAQVTFIGDPKSGPAEVAQTIFVGDPRSPGPRRQTLNPEP